MKRFGELSEAIEVRLSQAAMSDLELWAERFFEARTLSKVYSFAQSTIACYF